MTSSSGASYAVVGQNSSSLTSTVTLDNSGTITGYGGLQVYAYGDSGSITLRNSGTITASNLSAVDAEAVGTSVSIALTNSGTIQSGGTAVSTGDAPTTIVNTGSITSTALGGTAIQMGAGTNSLTIGTGSTITGFVLNGSTNAGTLSVHDGNLLVLGGAGSDSFDLAQIAARPSQLGYALTSGVYTTNNAVSDTTHQYQGFSTFQKTGSGTFNLNGTTSNDGAWAVQAGTLNVNGVLPGAVSVANGATLGGGGTVGAVTVASGGTMTGVQGQTLTTGALTLLAGSHVAASLGGASAAPLFQVNGALSISATLDLTSSASNLGSGVYRLFNYTGALTGSGLTLGTFPSGLNVPDLTIQTSVSGQINIVSEATTTFFWNGGNGGNGGTGAIQGGSGTWNADSIWTNASGSSSGTIKPASFVVFQGAAGTVTVDTAHGPVAVGGMQFVTNGYVVTGGPIALLSAQSTIRVGDGTLSGAGTVATIASSLTGTSQLVKADYGTLLLTGNNTYTGGTLVQAGTLAIGNHQAAGSGDIVLNEGSTLAFASSLQLANGITFPEVGDPIIDTGSNIVTLSGSISGVGDLAKIGPGTLRLTGTNSYSGTTDVKAGTLLVDGSTADSIVKVGRGATLGGGGTVGGVVAQSGSIVAPGVATPYDTLNVAGKVIFSAGSTYQLRINTNGQTDSIATTGTAKIKGGTVDVLAESGVYSPTSIYRILSATGGRTGQFSSLITTSNLAFLTPLLNYDATGVELGFTHTPAAPFPSVAATPNQVATAAAIESLGAGAALYDAVLSQSSAGARQAFNAASGEIHASASTAGLEDTRMVREAAMTRMLEADWMEGTASRFVPAKASSRFVPWGQSFGEFGRDHGSGNAAALSRTMGGFVLGGDTRVDSRMFSNWRVGLLGGYTSDTLRVGDRSSSGTLQSAFGGLYASARYGAVDLRLGTIAGGTWTDTRRTIVFSNFIQEGITAHSAGDVVQGFGEVGYRIGFARGFLEPVVGGAAIRVVQDPYRESAGSASVRGFASDDDLETVTGGLRAEAMLFASLPIAVRGFLAYRHAFGDVNPTALQTFEAGSSSFAVTGASIDRDAFVTEFGLTYESLSPWMIGATYSGQYGARTASSAVKGHAEYRF